MAKSTPAKNTAADKRVARVTRKTKKVVMLPEMLNYVQQPNRVTKAQYDFTLTQKKIFTAVLYGLQESIKARLEGKSYEQLSIFQTSSSSLQIKIPLSDITRDPTYYSEVKEAAQALASLVIKLPGVDPFTGKTGSLYKGMMGVLIPDDSKYDRHLVIEIDKDVAKRLMEIEKNAKGIPINYTRYAYEIIMQAKCKYTPRIYELISSWKQKGGFVITVADLREILMLGDKYPTYKDFKNRVIKPVHEELYEKADCWFNCNATDFEIREGKSVTRLNFKVIVPEIAEHNQMQREQIKTLLRTHFQFKEEHFKQIEGLLNNYGQYDKLNFKLIELNDFVSERKKAKDPINNIPAYTVKSLLAYFK